MFASRKGGHRLSRSRLVPPLLRRRSTQRDDVKRDGRFRIAQSTCACANLDGREEATGSITMTTEAVKLPLESKCTLCALGLKPCSYDKLNSLLGETLEKTSTLAKRTSGKKKKKPWHQDDTFVFSICAVTSQIFLSFLGLFKIIFGQDQLVGRDWSVSIVYIIGRGFFYYTIVRAQSVLLKLSLKGYSPRKFRDLVKKANKLAIVSTLLSTS